MFGTDKYDFKVGIYGSPEAGKTTFLYLFNKYLTDNRTERVHQYSKVVPDFLPQDCLKPTERKKEYVFSFNENKFHYKLRIVDQMGEILRIAADNLNKVEIDLRPEKSGNNSRILLEMIKGYHLLLFMFDPTGGHFTKNEKQPDQAVICKEHLMQEKKHAHDVLKSVIERKRGKNKISILFVITHQDKYKQLSSEDRKIVDDWLEDVVAFGKANGYPLTLEDNVFRVSSLEDIPYEETGIQKVIDNMLYKGKQSIKQTQSKKNSLLSLIFFMFVSVVGICLFCNEVQKWREIHKANQARLEQEKKTELARLVQEKKDKQARLEQQKKEELEKPYKEAIAALCNISKDMSNAIENPERIGNSAVTLDKALRLINSNPSNKPDIFHTLCEEFKKTFNGITDNILNDSTSVEDRLNYVRLLDNLPSEKVKKIFGTNLKTKEIEDITEKTFKEQLVNEIGNFVKQEQKNNGNAQKDWDAFFGTLIEKLNDKKNKISDLEIFADSTLIPDIETVSRYLHDIKVSDHYTVNGYVKIEKKPENYYSSMLGIKFGKQEAYEFKDRLEKTSFSFPKAKEVPELKVFLIVFDKERDSENPLGSKGQTGEFVKKESRNLASLGMPLVFKETTSFKIERQDKDQPEKDSLVLLEFVFNQSEKVPALLWEILMDK